MLLDDEDEVTTPTLDLKDPMAVASRIRVNREMLESYRADVAKMIDNLRTMHPQFGVAWDEVKRLEVAIPELEERLKDIARERRCPLDLSPQGIKVKYSNPVKRSLAFDALLSVVPNIEALLPDAIIRTGAVDLKVVDVAVAAGALPQEVLRLIVETPTTKAGRVEIENVKKK